MTSDVRFLDGPNAPPTFYINDGSRAVELPVRVVGSLFGTATWNPASVADGAASAAVTVSVPGADPGDPARAGLTTLTTAGAYLQATVTAADTVSVILVNRSGGAVDPASGTLTVVVDKTS